jgi:hypothetical protein
MKLSSIDIGSKIMFFMGAYLFVLSLLWIFLTETMFISDVLVYTGQSWSELLANSPKTAELYIITKKLIGFFLLLLSILILFITNNFYKKGEKWAWYSLLITGIFIWGGLLGYRFLIGYWASTGIITFVLGTVLFIFAIVIPAKAILGKKSI